MKINAFLAQRNMTQYRLAKLAGLPHAITAVPDGIIFEHIATAANGWHAVIVGSRVGWVSGKYSEIITE